MPPELRKRKAPASEPTPAPPAKKKGPVAKAVAKVKEVIAPKTTSKPTAAKTNGSSSNKIAVGETINLEGFGGEIESPFFNDLDDSDGIAIAQWKQRSSRQRFKKWCSRPLSH